MRKISMLIAGLVLSISSFAQNWSLTGNAGLSPTTNFLGTTDTSQLIIRTDNIERMRIINSGLIGIGTTSPSKLLDIYSTTADHHLLVHGTAPSVALINGLTESGVSSARFALSTASSDYIAGSIANDVILSNYDTTSSLLFGVGTSAGNGIERMRINKIGYIGIAQASPKAKFDVNCAAVTGQTNPSNIRFESLQSGSGTTLVIDSNGYVYKSSGAPSGAMANSPLVTDMQNQIQDLQSQIQELRSLLSTRLAVSSNELKQLNNESASWLGDVHPNPANNSTTIDYSLPSGVGAAVCQVYSLSGAQVAAIALPAAQGKSQVQLNTSQLAAGMYIYSLVVDGKVLGTKQLAVVR